MTTPGLELSHRNPAFPADLGTFITIPAFPYLLKQDFPNPPYCTVGTVLSRIQFQYQESFCHTYDYPGIGASTPKSRILCRFRYFHHNPGIFIYNQAGLPPKELKEVPKLALYHIVYSHYIAYRSQKL